MKKTWLILTLLSFVTVCCAQKPADSSFYAYTLNQAPFRVWTSPDESAELLMTLPQAYDYEFPIDSPRDGWWRIQGGYIYVVGVPEEEDPIEYLIPEDKEGWVRTNDLFFTSVMRHTEDLVFRTAPSETADAAFVIPREEITILHPLDVKGDWVKVQETDSDNIGWVTKEFLCLSSFEVCEE